MALSARAGAVPSVPARAADLVGGNPTAGEPYTIEARVPAPYGPGTLDDTTCPDASFSYEGGSARVPGRLRFARGSNELEVTAAAPIVCKRPGPAWIHLDLHCRYRRPGVKNDYYHLFAWNVTVQPSGCSARSVRLPASSAAQCRTGRIDVRLEWSALPSTDDTRHALSATCVGSLTFASSRRARYTQTFSWHEDWSQTDPYGNRLEVAKDATGGNQGTLSLAPEVAYTSTTSYVVGLVRRPPDFTATIEQRTTQSGPGGPSTTAPAALSAQGNC